MDHDHSTVHSILILSPSFIDKDDQSGDMFELELLSRNIVSKLSLMGACVLTHCVIILKNK